MDSRGLIESSQGRAHAISGHAPWKHGASTGGTARSLSRTNKLALGRLQDEASTIDSSSVAGTRHRQRLGHSAHAKALSQNGIGLSK